jgi:hypothetical protein
MSLEEFAIKHLYTIFFSIIIFYTLLMSTCSLKWAFVYASFGIVVLCVVDRYQEKLMREMS